MLEHVGRIRWGLFWSGVLISTIGFVLNRLWTQVHPVSMAVMLGLAFGSLVVAVLPRRWLRCHLATAVLLVWLVALAYFAGFSTCVAVGLLALSALGLGSLFLDRKSDASSALALLAGLGLVGGTVGWLLAFPLHYRASYLLLLLATIALRWRSIISSVRGIPAYWEAAVAEAPASALLATIAIGTASTYAWLPALRYDDLAYHLALPSQLASSAYYQMNVGSNIWAVAPWVSDVLQGMTGMLAGEESVGAVNMLWLAITAVLIWKLCGALHLAAWQRWIAVALYASMPMNIAGVSSMHTEGPTAAVAAGLALLIQQSRGPDRRELLLAASLFGLLLGLKLSNLTLAGPLGLWLLCRWRCRLPWRSVPGGLLLGLLSGGSSYVYAWVLTKNPVLPLFNDIFHSPYFPPRNFHDKHWDSGLGWKTPWDLVFHTSKFIEGGDGFFGLLFLVLLGSLLAALFVRRSRPLALVGIVAFLLPLTQIQYLRYAHPTFALLIPAMLAGIPVHEIATRRVRAVYAVLLVLVISNVIYVSATGRNQTDEILPNRLRADRPSVLQKHSPSRVLAEFIKQRYGPHARTLITSGGVPFAAEYGGKAFVVSWYDQELSGAATNANRDASGKVWSDVFAKTGVNLVILQKGKASEGLWASLAEHGATSELQVGDLELFQLHSGAANVVVSTPPRTVVIKFDASATPRAPTLVDVEIEVRCQPLNVPIVVGWRLETEGGHKNASYQWSRCTRAGQATLSLSTATAARVTALSVTATPASKVDMGLEFSSAHASFRRDLARERDLAARMRAELRDALSKRAEVSPR